MPQSPTTTDDRAAVNLVDIVLGLSVLVCVIALAPVFYKAIGMGTSEAGPFTSLVLQLMLPTLIIGVVLSIGVSASRRT